MVTDGRFTGHLPAGKYRITVSGINTTRYEQPAKSKLTIEVLPGENSFDFQLTTR